MRLRLLPDEITQRKTNPFRISGKKLDDLQLAIKAKHLIALMTPVNVGGRNYSIILPEELAPTKDRKHELSFKPIWNRCHIVCKARSNKINLIVLQLDNEQVSFDGDGVNKTSFSVTGSGIGEAAAIMAESALSKLIDQEYTCPIVNRVVGYIKQVA